MDAKPHSAEYLGPESRDSWWSPDFLDLVASRWGIAQARRGLDVGAGVGHRGRPAAPAMPPGGEVVIRFPWLFSVAGTGGDDEAP
ncbi:MAG: hypothetical protein AB1730_04315 [Myxococcota bacterium]|jgi:hypothetical protein